MKKRILPSFFLLFGVALGYSQHLGDVSISKEKQPDKKLSKKEAKILRKKHEQFLAHNKINRAFYLSKQQRKEEGIPPNKYNEQEWLLTMNPSLGRPTNENIEVIRKDLEKARQQALAQRIPEMLQQIIG
ncbi:hypothetical protein [Flavobacterium davisii]|uniref:Uncharacterized protein n=1 Tax=Flavobacterium columnare TaxID=996 RepID=A0A8G0P8G1_9FLAO|nr:hypothetical protein [Flavobacterium davisii]QYS89954.1 hypothetical protein JJC05_07350 [Flavobacterium davisii]